VDLEASDLEAPKHGHRAAAGERKEGDDEIRASAGERDPVVEILWSGSGLTKLATLSSKPDEQRSYQYGNKSDSSCGR